MIPAGRADLNSKLTVFNTRYDYVVNAAGYTGKPNVDACRYHKADVLESNVLLPALLTEWCGLRGIPLVHVSSGCIYNGDGPKGIGFSELDVPNLSFIGKSKCSIYSGSKASAEHIVRGYSQHHILRLRMPFNGERSARNLLVKYLAYNKLVDVKNSITHVDDFIASTVQIIDRKLPFGTWNLVNPDAVTTRDIMHELAKIGGLRVFDYFNTYEEFAETVEEPRSVCTLSANKALEYRLPLRPTLNALSEAWRELATGLSIPNA